jgi:hypothetical protein
MSSAVAPVAAAEGPAAAQGDRYNGGQPASTGSPPVKAAGPPVGVSPLPDYVVDPAFLFQRVHKLRFFARMVSTSQAFEVTVLAAIFVNLIAMSIEDISAQRAGVPSLKNDIIARVDMVTLGVFVLEFLAKVLTVGVAPLPAWVPSYLRPDPLVIPVKRVDPVPPPAEVAAMSTPTAPSGAAAPEGDTSTSIAAAAPAPVLQPRRSTPNIASVLRAVKERESAALLLDSLSTSKPEYYFSSGWNRLDFALLMVGLASLVSPAGSSGLGALRALRALRPLRAFRFFAPLQSIINSIWLSARLLVNVFVCLGFFFLLFGLMGQQFFQVRVCVHVRASVRVWVWFVDHPLQPPTPPLPPSRPRHPSCFPHRRVRCSAAAWSPRAPTRWRSTPAPLGSARCGRPWSAAPALARVTLPSTSPPPGAPWKATPAASSAET